MKSIQIPVSSIVEDNNSISLKMPTEQIENIKKTYGIDIENKTLLVYLKKYGGLSITASAFTDIMNSCQTEEELDREDERELLAAKAGMAIVD